VTRSVILRLRIPPSEIAFFRFILEGHEGLALMRTLDPRSGAVCLHIAPGCEREVTALLKSLFMEMRIRDESQTDIHPHHRMPDERP